MFNFNDLLDLDRIFGSDDMFSAVETGCMNATPTVIVECLRIGLKKRDASGSYAKMELAEDNPCFALSEASEPIMDALCLSQSGKTYQAVIEEAVQRQQAFAEEQKRRREAGEDPDGPFGLLATSSGLSPTGLEPASGQPKSAD